MEVLDRLVKEDPGYLDRLNGIEKNIQDYLKSHPEHSEAVITIPVVVHVVYRTSSQNISVAQIQSQIDVLNRDFRKLNTDVGKTPAPFVPHVADCMIQFCLAIKDPNGNTTTGITRTYTKKTSFSTNDFVKYTSKGGKDAWPRDKYLNMWVCNLSNGILGYAQFPGGRAATDGVVINYRAFGTTGAATPPFDLGRTATHEIGHWLNLRHIWGDDGGACSGNDFVDDTPNQGPQYYGCPAFPQITCSNGPDGAMFMNYMDYTDDRCMYMFTNGQSGRMNAILNGVRLPIQSSNGCFAGSFIVGNPNNTSDPVTFRLEQNYPNPFNPSTSIRFSIPEAGNVSIKIYDISGKVTEELVNSLFSAGSHEVKFDGANYASGIYYYELNANGMKDTKKMLLVK
jgi:hypothetical protein